MHGRRSQGGFLLPANDNINRVGQLARQFEGLNLVVDLGNVFTVEMEEQGERGGRDERDCRDKQGVRESPLGSPTRALDVDIRAMKESAQLMIGNQPSSIVLDGVARSYEVRSMHLNMLPSYSGKATKDCLQFMRDYQSIMETFPIGRLIEEQLRMRCFRYNMKDKAKQWFGSLKAGTFTSWDDVC